MLQWAVFDWSAVDAFSDWNQAHPNSRWSYVKYAVALSLNNECDAALASVDKLEASLNSEPSMLMESWIAWGHKVCGRDDLYQQSKSRIQAGWDEDPDGLDPGYVYLLALEGDTQNLVRLLNRYADTRSPFTAYISIFAIDYLGWDVSDEMPSNAEFRTLRQQLNFPVIDI
jgi:hypothetical protein